MKTNTFMCGVSKFSVAVKTPKWWPLESQVMEACDTLETFWVYFCRLETEIIPWWWVFKSHCHWLISVGLRTCPVFLQYAVIERNSQVPKRQESWWLPRGEAETPQAFVPLQQCPGRARGTSSMGRRERKHLILTLPAPGWQTSLLAAKLLGAASDWISQPGKSSKKGKRVKPNIGKTCQMAARKQSAASRPEASKCEHSRVWHTVISHYGESLLPCKEAASVGGSGVFPEERALQVCF